MPKGYRKIMGKVKLCYQVLKQNFPMGHLLGSSSLKKRILIKIMKQYVLNGWISQSKNYTFFSSSLQKINFFALFDSIDCYKHAVKFLGRNSNNFSRYSLSERKRE